MSWVIYSRGKDLSPRTRAKSAYIAYRHIWSPGLRSSLILSASGTDTPGGGTFNGADRREAHGGRRGLRNAAPRPVCSPVLVL